MDWLCSASSNSVIESSDVYDDEKRTQSKCIDTIAVGIAEAPLLKQATRQPWPVASMEALRKDGVVLIPEVMRSTAAALRAHLESTHAAASADVASGVASENHYFCTVASRKERHFMRIALEPQVVSDAIAEALQVLAPFIRGMLGCDEPILVDLVGIRSTKGAPPQPIHCDDHMVCSEQPGRLNVFVALQDIDEKMGPTIFMPGTHTSVQAWTAVERSIDESTEKANLLRTGPIRLGTMTEGSCTMHHTGLLHAGGANDSGVRWLFHMSFAPTFVISVDLGYYKNMLKLGVHKMNELERGAIRSQDDDETKHLTSMWSAFIEDDEVKKMQGQYESLLWMSRNKNLTLPVCCIC